MFAGASSISSTPLQQSCLVSMLIWCILAGKTALCLVEYIFTSCINHAPACAFVVIRINHEFYMY